MLPRKSAKLLRFHLSEYDRCENKPLYEAVVDTCMRLQIAGVTVFRGMEGYGESGELHRRRLLVHDQPVVLTVVDSAEKIDVLVPELEKIIGAGVIAISNVEVIRIRNSRPEE